MTWLGRSALLSWRPCGVGGWTTFAAYSGWVAGNDGPAAGANLPAFDDGPPLPLNGHEQAARAAALAMAHRCRRVWMLELLQDPLMVVTAWPWRQQRPEAGWALARRWGHEQGWADPTAHR